MCPLPVPPIPDSDHRQSSRWCCSRDMNDRPVNGLLLWRGYGDDGEIVVSPVDSSILSLERTNRGSYCLSGRWIHLIPGCSPVVGRERRKKKTDASHVVDFSFNRQRIRLRFMRISVPTVFSTWFFSPSYVSCVHRLPFTTPPRLPISESSVKGHDVASQFTTRG